MSGAGLSRSGFLAFAVMACAAVLLFTGLGSVRAPIWDEAYYLTAEARFHEGRTQFAAHPPLGLMLITLGDTVTGTNASVNWHPVAAAKTVSAEQLPAGFDYAGPRFASALFGVMAAGLFFALMALLTRSAGKAALLSPLFVVDTALIAQFRAAQLDAFQVFFALLSVICLVKALQGRARLGWTAAFASAVIAATLVRSNALLLGVMGLAILWQPLVLRQWGQAARLALVAGGAAIITAFAVFWLALQISPLPPDPAAQAGRFDAAHITADYRTDGALLGTAEYARDYARFMGEDLASITRHDDDASHPWQWLIGGGATTYRWDANETTIAAIAPVPNRAAWLVSLAGVIAALLSLRHRRDPLAITLLGCWVINMAALVWLDAQRVMYVYHYFIPLMLGHALAALAWRAHGFDRRLVLPVLVGSAICAIAALPFVYNQPVPRWRCAIMVSNCAEREPTAGQATVS